jgi:hypothetical protein
MVREILFLIFLGFMAGLALTWGITWSITRWGNYEYEDEGERKGDEVSD